MYFAYSRAPSKSVGSLVKPFDAEVISMLSVSGLFALELKAKSLLTLAKGD